MASSQLLEQARSGDSQALVELAVGGQESGARGYSKSREEPRQAAIEGLQAARDNGDKKAQAFALYASLRLRVLQGERVGSCQAEAMEATRLLKELGEKKHAATMLLMLATNSLSSGFDQKPSAALRYASDAFGLFDDASDKAAALTTQARMGKGRIGEALLAARKSAELFHAIGDKDGEKTVAIAITKIQDKMPPPHRPQNVLLTSNPASAPTNLITQARHCVVWNNPCKEGAYINYNLELLRLIDDISKSTTQTPIVVCSMGAMGRHLGCPVPGQQKDINSMSIWGVVRTVRLEMPRMPIFTVDLPTDADGSELARVICDATQDSGPRSEVAYSKVAGDGQALLAKMGRDTQ